MNRKDLAKLAKDPRFISGIYNYCDRWCERCPITSRCLNYAMEQQSPLDPEDRDITKAAFWEHLRGIFEQTRQMLTEMAAERGIPILGGTGPVGSTTGPVFPMLFLLSGIE